MSHFSELGKSTEHLPDLGLLFTQHIPGTPTSNVFKTELQFVPSGKGPTRTIQAQLQPQTRFITQKNLEGKTFSHRLLGWFDPAIHLEHFPSQNSTLSSKAKEFCHWFLGLKAGWGFQPRTLLAAARKAFKRPSCCYTINFFSRRLSESIEFYFFLFPLCWLFHPL